MKRIKHLIFGILMCLVSVVAMSFLLKAPLKEANALVSIPEGQTLDENVDTISVRDLTLDGVTNQSMIALNADSGKSYSFSYSDGNSNHNLVLRFKYDVVDMSDTSDKNTLEIYFRADDKVWGSADANKNEILFRGDGVYFKRYTDSFNYKKMDALTVGTHDIEFGRIALLDGDGNPTGNYYVYYILDGVKQYDSITPLNLEKLQNNMYIRYGKTNTKNRMYDADLSYETPQYVSVSDLTSGGNPVGNTVPAKDVSYPYNAAERPANHSTVFVAKLNYQEGGEGDIYIVNSSDNNWVKYGGWVSIRSNRIYIGINNSDGTHDHNGEYSYPSELLDGSIHNIEFGRLAVMKDGVFQNRYHLYFKLDGVIIYAIDQKIASDIIEAQRIHLTGNQKMDYSDAYTYEDAKEISVRELKDGNGNYVGNTLLIDGQKNLFYDNDDHAENYSIVFKYKYECLENKQNQFHLTRSDDKWKSASSFIINNDDGTKVNLGKSTLENNDAGFHNISYTMVVGKTYDVEYGRIALMYEGSFTGKYLVYLKIDNTIVKYDIFAIPQNVVKGNLVFITADGQNRINDVYQEEEAKEISVSDLKDGNTLVGNSLQINDQKNLSYDNTDHTENYSVVFKFRYEAVELKNNQIHLSNSNNKWDQASSFILNNNGGTQINFGKSSKTASNGLGWYNVTIPQAFVAGTVYDIEFGRIALMEGTEFSGKYHLYLKINNVIVKEAYFAMPEAIAQGNVVFITADGHNNMYDINAHYENEAHTLQHHEAVPHTCTEDGTVEYWSCSRCGKNFGDANAANELTSLVDPMGHALTHHEAVDATCTDAGSKEYWSCSACNKNFKEEACENEISNLEEYLPVAVLGHDYQWVIDKEASYTETGLRHKECTRCHDKQEEGTVIPMVTCEHDLEPLEGTAATCTTAGSKSYYECSICHRYYEDDKGQVEITDLEAYLPIAALGHSFGEWVEEVPATCTEDGVKAHKDCSVCHKHFDADGKEIEDLAILAPGHQFGELIAKVDPTCTEAGVKEHKDCSACHKHFDADGKEIEDLAIAALGHELTHHAAVAPTLEEAGNLEYWSCSRCHKNFSDEEGKHELASTVLTLEQPKVLGVSDLKKSGQSIGNVFVATGHTDLTFDNADHKDNYSLVFRFKYQSYESAQNQFHLSCSANKWDGASSIILNNDKGTKVHLGKSTSEASAQGWHDIKFNMALGTIYNVEFGRLAVMNGDEFTGQYYVFLMIDNQIIKDMITGIPTAVVQGDVAFLTADGKNMIYDTNVTMEEAKVISISDLMKNNASVGNIINIKEAIEYTFDNSDHKDNYSLLLKFKYESLDSAQNQFHLTNSANKWNPASSFIINNDGGKKVHIGKSTSEAASGLGWYDIEYTMPKDLTYEVELGRLAVLVDGEPSGNYFVYLRVNGTIVKGYEMGIPQEVLEGNTAFITADGKNTLYDIAYVPCGDTHTLVHHEAVAATCTQDGTIEYWACSNCGKLFADEAGTQEITDIKAPKHHTLEAVAAVAPTCTEDGTIAHFHCSVCSKNFSDEAGQHELASIVDPKHHTLEAVSAVAPTCTEDGTVAHFHCSVCSKNFSDEAGEHELVSLVDPKHHTLEAVAAVAPTCTEAGNIAHFACSVCGKTFKDQAGTEELADVALAPQHTLVHREAVAPTCTEDGNIEYWHCSECGKNFSDAEGKNQITNVVEPAHHTLVHHDRVEATCTAEGNIEYWECSECHKKFSDAQGTTEVADVRIPQKAHSYNNGVCDNCGAQDPDYKAPRKFGCKSSVSATAVFFLLGVACLVYKKKKEELL